MGTKVSGLIVSVASLAWATLAHAGHRSNAQPDCGLHMHHALIARTEALVAHKTPLVMPISEAPTQTGHFECTRFTFGIDAHGKPSNIKLADTTGNFLVAIEARRTLKRYRFHVPAKRTGQRYSLVFSGMVDKALPPLGGWSKAGK